VVTGASDATALLALAATSSGERPPPVFVVPNGVDLAYFAPTGTARDADEIVFAGRMSYHANVAAAVHLVEQVMPLVWRERPAARVTIAGAAPAPRVRALARREERVRVTGGVPDIRPYLGRAAVAACPLVYAAGIQNKVLEAMACATPVVASSEACDALGVRPGVHLLQADGATAFAGAVLRLLGDEDLRRRLGRSGREYVEAQHDWGAVTERLEDVYARVLRR
jgi:glycosyltransferase involved in cell wall biosynthesis